MARLPALPATADLSVASVMAQARSCLDWHEDGFAYLMGESERLKVIIPEPDAEEIENRGLVKDEDGAWENSDGWYDYEQSCSPMMNVMWPVRLHYGADLKSVADLIAKHAPSCCLMQLDDDDDLVFIGLTGGGMDLSFYLASAYLCAGSVPPVELTGRDWAHELTPRRLPMARRLVAAINKGAKTLAWRAKVQRTDAAKLSKAIKAAAAPKVAQAAE